MKLSVQGVSFCYRSEDVVSDVSFEAGEGQIVGILGPNGSGKTTLLKCINRVLSPKNGTVFINGVDYREKTRKQIAQQIGVVPQSANSSFPFTALDIVMMGRNPDLERFEREKESDLQIVSKAMEMTNTSFLADRPMDQLSGGERQRVIIARALAQRPRIMLLDEPTLHLDVNHQIEILDLISRLAREERMLVIIVTHDLSLAARYCDRIILMRKGRIVSAGDVTQVLTRENMAKVFSINAAIYYDERIGTHNVAIIGAIKEGNE
ncbi:MAG: ABC transporter ATP-binding protein [Methanomassiliicoccaceae archaeon]|nr:ABC transporter ATP-binding protein [Euryarchaeota archaeon]HOB38671.1 ABC transporter ATP-binding protein [Methanomassiliicoccaceae archaeon]HQA21072.1 ABC transporter ATP-binding protein [Methanomassiliicoccaceae archaeon]HQD88875.1 ABC transporter ATP-binding protein [Methanomassiliicoccaceae archaeon]